MNEHLLVVGSIKWINVLTIAKIVTDALGLRSVAIRPTAKPGGRARLGDVKTMQLDIAKIKRLGWRPKRKSDEAIRLAARQLAQKLWSAE